MQALAGLRTVANEYNAVLIGETWTDNISELKYYYGAHHEGMQMPMDLMFTQLKPLSGRCISQARRGGERLGRVAGVRDEQSRHPARL